MPNGFYGNNAAISQQYPQNAAYPQQYTQHDQPRATLMPLAQVVAAWVRSYDMAVGMALDPNKIAFMVDDENNKIYVKRSDQFGRQSPVQTYDYVAPPPEKPAVDLSGYVTAEQFGGFVTRFDSLEDKINGLFDSLAAPKRRARREEPNDDE